MKRVVLDSSPTIPIRIPDDVSFSMPSTYQRRKPRGQPLLGQHQAKYTHFVPMAQCAHMGGQRDFPQILDELGT